MHQAPRRRFSQNFLVDRHYIGRIVDAIAPSPADALIEIGPGRGAMTRALIERGARVVAIEIDRDLAAALAEAFDASQLSVVVADALTVDLAMFANDGQRLRVVGNLPYHISSPLLFHCARYVDILRDCTFMLQAEVVDRMAAAPATPEYGRLSVSLQSLFSVDKLFGVPPGAFFPMPAVDSAIVRLNPLPDGQRPSIRDRAVFDATVAAAFGQRRKTLRNAVRELADATLIESVGIDPGARGETLSVADYARLANAIVERRAPAPSAAQPVTQSPTQPLSDPAAAAPATPRAPAARAGR